MPSSPFPPRPVPSRQDEPYRLHLPQTEVARTPRSALRPTPPHDPPTNPSMPRPQPPSIPSSSSYHHHTSSSPELRTRARPYPYPAQAPNAATSHTTRGGQHEVIHRRSGFAVRVNPLVPGIRGRSASEVRFAHTPSPDLESDRLARACGQQTPTSAYRYDDRTGQPTPTDDPSSNDRLAHPLVPKIKLGRMYRRLDALARRAGHRAMDYVASDDLALIHSHDGQLREQLRRKRSERLQSLDPSFHAIGAPLEDVLLYASTPVVIGDYQHHLPIVVVACVEELTKTGKYLGIYQTGLFRALPSRDRHLQLIDLFDKSRDFGAQFNMRGQAMPDICALLSTFISSLPNPLLDPHIHSALWHWSVKPSVKRDDARRDRQEEEEEDRRARGEPPRPEAISHTHIYLDDVDSTLETDQVSTAQVLLRFLPSANLSLLVYLCSFFTQLPLCPENGLQLEDVARIFGHRLLGGSAKVVSQRMMMWLLTRWHRISETLFSEMCGLTPSSSPVVADGHSERIEKRKSKTELESEGLPTSSSSPSSSSPSTDSPEDRGTLDGKEEGESSEDSRRRKKREVDVQVPRAHVRVGRPSTRKEVSHGHRRHHPHGHARSSELVNTPGSPDPFAMAFAKAQDGVVSEPLSSATTTIGDKHADEKKTSREVDARIVDVLVQEAAVATDVARALAARVDVLERALALAQGRSSQSRSRSRSRSRLSPEGDGDGLRARLRQVEAERDDARRVVRDVRACFLDT